MKKFLVFISSIVLFFVLKLNALAIITVKEVDNFINVPPSTLQPIEIYTDSIVFKLTLLIFFTYILIGLYLKFKKKSQIGISILKDSFALLLGYFFMLIIFNSKINQEFILFTGYSYKEWTIEYISPSLIPMLKFLILPLILIITIILSVSFSELEKIRKLFIIIILLPIFILILFAIFLFIINYLI